jgi:hypothetical protein
MPQGILPGKRFAERTRQRTRMLFDASFLKSRPPMNPVAPVNRTLGDVSFMCFKPPWWFAILITNDSAVKQIE